ncbi:COG4654 Cytochrome c551/c552 [Burkholderiaceae bacterium]
MRVALLLMATTLWSSHCLSNEALARKSGCLGCHAVASNLVGPSFKEVAARYADKTDAKSLVNQSIRAGSQGKWGDMAMPPHAHLPAADTQKLAQWILQAK